MKAVILGNGIAGTTLYSLLRRKRDVCVDIYGKKSTNICGIKSCAWGVNTYKFKEICSKLGLDYYKYCLKEVNKFHLLGTERHCRVTIINKVLLLEDLAGNNIIYDTPELEKYDRIIDATGQGNGARHTTYQIKVETCQELKITIGLFPSLHSKWIFPLSDNTAHIGILSFSRDLNGIDKKLEEYNPICKCYSSIHTGGVDKHLVNGRTWKVGESAGIVDPITGSGILPAMTSAIILYENWNNGEQYKRAIMREFNYMNSTIKAIFHNKYRGIPIHIV